MDHRILVVASLSAALITLGAAVGRLPARDGPDDAGCLSSIGIDVGLVNGAAINPGTFTAAGIQTGCASVPGYLDVACQACFGWQLTQWLGGNVWQVVAPYPVIIPIGTGCDTQSDRDYTTTTPLLGPGFYVMEASIGNGPCVLDLGGVQAMGESIMFQIVAP